MHVLHFRVQDLLSIRGRDDLSKVMQQGGDDGLRVSRGSGREIGALQRVRDLRNGLADVVAFTVRGEDGDDF